MKRESGGLALSPPVPSEGLSARRLSFVSGVRFWHILIVRSAQDGKLDLAEGGGAEETGYNNYLFFNAGTVNGDVTFTSVTTTPFTAERTSTFAIACADFDGVSS